MINIMIMIKKAIEPTNNLVHWNLRSSSKVTIIYSYLICFNNFFKILISIQQSCHKCIKNISSYSPAYALPDVDYTCIKSFYMDLSCNFRLHMIVHQNNPRYSQEVKKYWIIKIEHDSLTSVKFKQKSSSYTIKFR